MPALLGLKMGIFTNNPVRTSCNFFRLGSAFLEGEMTEPSLKKLREVRTQFMVTKNRFSVATKVAKLPVSNLESGGTLGATEILVIT